MTKKILSVILTMAMMISSFGFAVFAEDEAAENWIDLADTTWYNDVDTEFTLDTAEELAGLAELVNGGNTFNKKTIKLAADIDLAGKEWTPIGTGGKAFKGYFDGKNFIISNLKVKQNIDCAGLFGSIYATVGQEGHIINVKIHNADIYGKDYTAAVVGKQFTTPMDNCHVSGIIKIDGNGYVGGISGHSYQDITNCSVIGDTVAAAAAETENKINSRYWSVGGIVGQFYNGTIKDVEVKNINIAGNYYATAGVAGLAQTDGSKIIIENAHVANLNINNNGSEGAGSIVGTGSSSGSPIYVINYSVSNVNTANNGVATDAVNGTDELEYVTIGTDKNSEGHISAVITDGKVTEGTFIRIDAVHLADGLKAYENSTGHFKVEEQSDAAISEEKYKTLADAVEAAEDGDTITLRDNIVLDETLEIGADKNLIIDLAGKAITVTKSADKSLYAFDNKGTLELKDSVGGGSITARGNYNFGTLTMNGGNIIVCDTNGGYGVWNREGANFTMNGGTVNVPHYGSYADTYGPTGLGNMPGATMTINNGIINSNSMRAYAVASEGTLTINNANITGFRGVAVDAGTAVINGGTITALDATIGDAPESYYALYLEEESTVTVNGGTFNAANYFVNILGSLDIKDGYFNAGIGSNEEIYLGTIEISGGYFATDISDFLAEGKKLSASEIKPYVYKVVNEADEKIETPTTKIDENINNDNFTGTGITDAKEAMTTAMQSKNTENSAALADAAEKLVVEEAEVPLTKKPYLEIQNVVVSENSEDNTKPDTLKYTVKAVCEVVATESLGTAEITVTQPITMSLPVPADVVVDGKIMVKHTKDGGAVFYYEATVENEGGTRIATFTNPNGFSTFEILPTNDVNVVAKVGDSGFATLQAAVDYIDNNGTVTVVKNENLTVTFTESKTFTVKNEYKVDAVDTAITVTVNGIDYPIAAAGTESITYTKPVSSNPSTGGGAGTLYTVAFDTNGGSSIKSIKASRGKLIDEPTAPTKPGYIFDGWYKDKEFATRFNFDTTVINKDITLYAKWIKSGEEEVETPEEEKTGFNDVKASDWFFNAVKFVTDNGLMNGVSANEFAPDTELTRAMLVTILYRNEGEPENAEKAEFTDIEDGFYYVNAVAWAKANGIVNGVTETEFAPNSNITREQIAAIIFRYAQYKGMEMVNLAENLTAYTDGDKISEYAVSALNWAVGSGLINGKTTSTINPQDNATRAEIATILQRFIEMNK